MHVNQLGSNGFFVFAIMVSESFQKLILTNQILSQSKKVVGHLNEAFLKRVLLVGASQFYSAMNDSTDLNSELVQVLLVFSLFHFIKL